MELCEEGNQGTPAPPFAEYRSDPLLLMNFKLAKVLLKSGVSAGTAVHYIINWKLTKGQQPQTLIRELLSTRALHLVSIILHGFHHFFGN